MYDQSLELRDGFEMKTANVVVVCVEAINECVGEHSSWLSGRRKLVSSTKRVAQWFF